MRRADWQLRLAEFAKKRVSMPFEWGRNDCCLFTVDAVLAMTGVDYAARFRGYSTALAAARVVEQQGGIRQLAVDAWGAPVSPLLAGVGDVVLVINESRELLAVCNGTTAIGPGPDGLAVMDMSAAIAAWKI
ncbi:DUF6950 family protein [Variovorax sp. UMC13]|uniref:DUF6950 family protein n=1 Tax=Variovorax sp. UMC13 TaxID=1862326 RepID=UPI00160481A8|nr:hypothetical protein [Variovorax sp. UMC13]